MLGLLPYLSKNFLVVSTTFLLKMMFSRRSNNGGPILKPTYQPSWVPPKAANQIKIKPSQSGMKPLPTLKVSPMMKRSESPGKKEVKINAVSKNMTVTTAKTAQSPNASMIDCASSQSNTCRLFSHLLNGLLIKLNQPSVIVLP
jgi:hypothetical protein